MKFVVTLPGVLILAASLIGQAVAEDTAETAKSENNASNTRQSLSIEDDPQPVPRRLDEADTVVKLATPVTIDTLSPQIGLDSINMTQFSGDDLLIRGVGVGQNEVFRHAANVSAISGIYGSLAIRGISDGLITDTFDTGSSSKATVFLNQAAISRDRLAFLPPSLWDTEKVEILRGPQSVLYGSNTLAGAVIYDFKDPVFSWEGRSRFEVAENDTYYWAITQNIPIVDDVLAARIAYERRLSDGYVDNITRDEDDFGRTDRQDLRLQTLWQPRGTDDASVHFTYLYSENRGNDFIPFHGTQTNFFDRTSTFDNDDFSVSQTHGFILEGFFQLNENWKLDTITSFQNFDSNTSLDRDLMSESIATTNTFIDQNIYSQTVQFSFDGEGPMRALVGLYGEYSDYRKRTMSGLFPFRFSSTASETKYAAAAFANIEYDITDRLAFEAGLRLNYEEHSVSALLFSDNPFLPFEGTASGTNNSFDILPRWSLRYKVSEGHTVGALVSKGFRSGGVSVAPGAGPVQVRNFDPEHAWNYELFYRGSFFDDRLSVKSNLFYTDWNSQQVPTNVLAPLVIVSPSFLIDNSGQSELYGWELEIDYDLTSELSLFASAGWVETRFEDYLLNYFAFLPRDLGGLPFPNAPKWTASLGLEYLNDNGIFGSIIWNYRDVTYSQAFNPEASILEPRHLLSGKLGFRSNDGWQIYCFVDNLLGEDYSNFRLNQSHLIPEIADTFGIAGKPRTYGIGVEVNW